MESKILEDGADKLTISIQTDTVGLSGDVRDVLIIRRDINWEIGVSVKHNHFALKHSRLSDKLDFGQQWLRSPCSDEYFKEIRPYFDELKTLKTQKVLWRNVPNKDKHFYVPILNAFITELSKKFSSNKLKAASKIIKYLFGNHDYYKLIAIDSRSITRVIPFNLYGTLNTQAEKTKPQKHVPLIELPTRKVELSFKPKSTTTVNLIMDNGWQISFRIHNASSKVENSLKFDIQLTGQPTDLFFIDTPWE